MEIIDIVDANDKVVGTEEKDVARQKGLAIRVSFVIILNARDELYLQQRKSTKKTYPLYWSGSAAGHVRAEESYLAAAERELEEELGVATELYELGKLYSTEDKEFVTFFVGRHAGPFRLEEAAIEKADFFSLEQLQAPQNAMKMTSFAIAVLPMIKQYLMGRPHN